MATTIILALLPVVAQAICPDGYTNWYNGKCFRYYSDEFPNYDAARQKCLDDGAELASIHNAVENDIVYAARPKELWTWIGLYCVLPTESTDHFARWLDASPYNYYFQPYYNTYTCTDNMIGVLLTETHYTIGKWYWQPKTTAGRMSLCQVEQDLPTGPCELNYSYQEELGLCIRVESTETTWEQADSSCRANNAKLVSIHNAQTNSFLRRLALSHNFDKSIFIGMRLDSTSDGVAVPRWTDNSTVDYQNFSPGMPNAIFGDCMAMETREITGDWISIHCGEKTSLPFLCSKPSPCPAAYTYSVSGDVYSPDYPASPSRAVNCEYLLAGTKGTVVIVDFDEIQLINDDQILLYDGAESDTPMAVVGGDSVGKRYMTVNDNVLRIVYQTGTTIGLRKWHARFNSF